MALSVGDQAPDFELSDETGTPRRLSELLTAGPVVLFWFPIAMTTGCTKEACHFRDLSAEFAKAGAQRVGISMDPVAKQDQFSKKHGFDYPLLADVEGTVAKQYGVRRGGLLGKLAPTRRITFVIGTDQKIVDVITGEIKFTDHADKALASLNVG
ncbi:MAG TPA: peroxiredoxin [Sporichthyaceae bacterium]|jgi:peroxiredoxin Q/BCP|nr:peroxiredoxin [Sporichthyaceae bacterium]